MRSLGTATKMFLELSFKFDKIFETELWRNSSKTFTKDK